MAFSTGSPGPDLPVKSEPPSNEAAISSILSPPSVSASASAATTSPDLKRRRSEEDSSALDGLKRQRVDSVFSTPPSAAAAGPSAAKYDFERLLAQATANTTQHLSRTARTASQTDQANHVNQMSAVSAVSAVNQMNAVDAQASGSRAEETSSEDLLGRGITTDPYLYMRTLSLPILESLSTQILATLAQGSYSETIKIVSEPESELGQAYATLVSLFDQTKKIYSEHAHFLSADDLRIREPKHRDTIRTTNLATFIMSVFGGQDVGFYELNDQFLDTFTQDGEPLGRELGFLFLNLKTQMFLSVASQEEQEVAKEDILEDLFPYNMEGLLLARHPETSLASSELEFVQALKERREYIMNISPDVESIQSLSERFTWEDFLRSLNIHLGQTYKPLIAPYMKRHALSAPAPPEEAPPHKIPINSIESDLSANTQRTVERLLQRIQSSSNANNLQNHGYQEQAQQPAPATTASLQRQSPENNVPFSQSAPTQALYERARQAAAAKQNPSNTRRPGTLGQRRAWTSEEENALMAGLDQVKGPHWSQILNLYGSNGQVSEVLKGRNQVQLKDKARNLKLFFLKSGIEVPYYLQSVTGELKTRAPSQAARKEAEERARLASDEEQARFNGILTLAQGIQNKPASHNGGAGGGEESSSQVMSSPAASFDSQELMDEFQVDVEDQHHDHHDHHDRHPVEADVDADEDEDHELRDQMLAAISSVDAGEDAAQRSGFAAVST